MNILRGTIASLLIAVFVPAVLASVFVWGALSAFTPEAADKAIVASRAGERLPALATASFAQAIKGIPLIPKGIDMEKVVADALSPARVNAALSAFVHSNLAYIRGEGAVPAAADISSFVSAAAESISRKYPALSVKNAKKIIDSEIASRGLDKWLAIPSDSLESARALYALANAASFIAPFACFVILLIIFAVAPHGLRGRLKYASVALLVPGIFVALIGAALPQAVSAAIMAMNDIPPETSAMAKGFSVSIMGTIGSRLLVAGGAFILCGAVCLVLMATLRRRPPSNEEKTA